MENTIFDLLPGDKRWSALPYVRKDIYDLYMGMRAAFWTEKEIDLSQDKYDFVHKLLNGERHAIKYVVAFFANSDGIVNANTAERFCGEIPMQDATYMYNMQMVMEDIHAITYAEILDAIIENPEERAELINAIVHIPVINKMSQYMFDCMASNAPLAKRLFKFMCVEGVFFQGAFDFIEWLATKNVMPGLVQSNELISRDEGQHVQGNALIYNYIRPEHKLSREKLVKLCNKAAEIGREFNKAMIPEPLIGMNVEMMNESTERSINNVLSLIHQDPIFTKFQYPVRQKINLPLRDNYFEKKVTSYSKQTSRAAIITDNKINFHEDF